MSLGKVAAHDPDQLHLGEVGRRQAEVDGRPAQRVLPLPERRFHVVEGDRSDYQDGHVPSSYIVSGAATPSRASPSRSALAHGARERQPGARQRLVVHQDPMIVVPKMGASGQFLQRVGQAVRLESVGGVGDDVGKVVQRAQEIDLPLGVQPLERAGDARDRGVPLGPLVSREHAGQPRVRRTGRSRPDSRPIGGGRGRGRTSCGCRPSA